MLMLCVSSCDKNEDQEVLVKYTIPLGETFHLVLDGVNDIYKYNYDNRCIHVDIDNENNLNISSVISCSTRIEIFYNTNQIKIIEIVVPIGIFIIEEIDYAVNTKDHLVSNIIKKDIIANSYTNFSEFCFNTDSLFIIKYFDENSLEKNIHGFYSFCNSNITIDTPQKCHHYEYLMNYKNINYYDVFLENLTDYYKGKYPDTEIESVFRIYKVIKKVLPG